MNNTQTYITDISIERLGSFTSPIKRAKTIATKADRDRRGVSLIEPNHNRPNNRTSGGSYTDLRVENLNRKLRQVDETPYTARKRRKIEK